jgi:Xaa-Pro aminopeptidase
MFDREFFAGNRAALRKACSADYILLSANGMVQKSADLVFPFRQDSNFWYLTGSQVADAILFMDLKKKRDIIILPERAKHRDLWEGAIDTAGLQKESGVSEVLQFEAGTALLKETAANKPKIGTIVPDIAYLPAYGMHLNPTKLIFRNRLRRMFGSGQMVDIRNDMARLRQVKQPAEIAAIQKAVGITLDSLAALKQEIGTMKSEQDVDIFLSHQFRLRGASGHGYDPIVGSGVNAATIHHERNNGPLVKNGLLLLDVGALYDGYSADISRTWVIGTPTKRQLAMYAAVKEAHTFALKLLKPGVAIRQYQKDVVAFLVDKLIAAGVYKEKDRAQHEKDYPHLISHHLGLDVHDAGLYDDPLVEGCVVTVEPGVYLPEDKIGVRIEDDILITKTGAKNLSAALPDDLLYLN